jgi:hypothetical protein
MQWTIRLEQTDGSAETVGDPFDRLEDAATFALKLADRLGLQATADAGARPDDMPRAVHIYRGDHIDLTVTIFRGGLLPPASGR